MIIDSHVSPGDLAPADLAQAIVDAGLDGVVIADNNRVDRLADYLDAAEDAGLQAFAGVELTLDRGTLVFVPRYADDAFFMHRWSPGAKLWALPDALECARALDGALLAGHPYHRDREPILGDLVYGITDIVGIETRVGQARHIWNELADSAMRVMKAAPLGTCGGDLARLGLAGTVIPGEIEDEAALVDALTARDCLAVELRDVGEPYRPPRSFEPPPRRSDDDQDERSRGRRQRRGGRRPERS